MVFLRGRSGAHPAKCDIPYSRREKYSSWKMLNVQSGEWLSESRFPGIFLGARCVMSSAFILFSGHSSRESRGGGR